MDLVIVQAQPCDVMSALKRLRDQLPEQLVDRTKGLDLRRDAVLPREVIRLEGADAADEALVSTALAMLAEPGLMVQRGGVVEFLPAAPVAETPADPDTVIAAIRPDLIRAGARTADPSEAIWKAVLERKASGIPFPQAAYAGKHAKAYQEIVRQFAGIVPHEDGGKNLKPADLDRLKRPKMKGIDKRAWNAVIDELRELLRFFEIAREWFDSGGKLRNNVRDQMFADMGFMLRLNTTYDLCDAKASVPLSLDLAMAIAGRILAQAHPMVGFVFAQLYAIAKAGRPGGGVVTAKIREMEIALHDVFELTIQTVEQTLIALVADWGNLAAFVGQVRSGKIDWPDAAAPIRRAHAVGFHTACLMTLMKLKSDTETYRYGNGTNTWGVVQYQQSCGDVKRHYEAKKGILRGKASAKDCLGGRWNDNWFFGSVYTTTGGGYGPPPPVIRLAPATLANKLFQTGTDADPGLGLSVDFLDNPKVRASWALHSVRTKYGGKI